MKIFSKKNRRFFIFFSLITVFFSVNNAVFAQIRRGVQKAKIMDSGVIAVVPCANPSIDTTHNADGSIMYVLECQMEKLLYNVVVIKSPTAATGTAAEREYRLIFYANQFKTMMEIETCPTFKQEQKLATTPDAVGVSYICEGKEGVKYAIQGWQYDKEIVLYAIAGTVLPATETMLPFFNSVVFAQK